jgi:hypothetical protein
MTEPQVPLDREITRLKMRLNRLLGTYVRVDDEALTDPDFVRAVSERYFGDHPESGSSA